MYTRGQTKFRPLRLSGREKPIVSPLDRLCNLRGCNKYIKAGDYMIRWGTFDLHIACAQSWCSTAGVEENYDRMVR